MKSGILLCFLSLWLSTPCFSQQNQQEIERVLSNANHEWKLDSTLQTLGRSRRCKRGEYILFTASPNTVVKRHCNDIGSWDTTRAAWSLTGYPGNKWYLKLGDTTYRLYLKDNKDKFILTLTFKEMNGDIKIPGTDKVYSAIKNNYD